MWTDAMSETDTQDQQDVQAEEEAIDEVLEDEAGTDVVQVIDIDSEDDEEAEDEEAEIRTLAIRHVIERQLVASQSLTEQLIEAATDVSAAVVHAPATAIDEIRRGATLPAAFANTGTTVREVVNTTGGRVRAAVGEYIDGRATLPKAVVVCASDVAESIVRAQGAVAATAVTGAFTVAGVAARGGDVREAIADERREVRAQAVAVREDLVESWRQAREHVEAARSVG